MSDIARAFAAFDECHPDVWQHFERLALDLWRRGRRHYSARTILHVIRHHIDTTAHASCDDSEFCINNNWSPFYSRRFMERHPECGDFFELRISVADDRSAIAS